MRIPSASSRVWYLLVPVLLVVAWRRIDELKTAHDEIWRLTGRYATVRQEMRAIRTNAMSRVKTEHR